MLTDHLSRPGNGRFATTCWPYVLEARDRDSEGAREALEALCRTYWYPLYAFVRRRGHAPDQAQDLTQGFFADLLSRDFLRSIDPAKGKFRVFLMVACRNYLSNQRVRAQYRFESRFIPIDREEGERCYSREPAHLETAERLFERRWALTLLGHALDELEREMARDGKGRLFELLKPFLTGEMPEGTFADLGRAIGKTADAVKMEAYRLRKRFNRRLREEIGRTVADPAEVEPEIRELFRALSPGRSPGTGGRPRGSRPGE